MKHLNLIGTGLIAIGAITGAAWAAPSKTDMDFCNQKAAQLSKSGAAQPGMQPGTPPSTGAQTDRNGAVAPGTAARPAPPNPQPGDNPTGGRITDSTQPGTPPSELGMAPAGNNDPAYRQAYLACINERQK